MATARASATSSPNAPASASPVLGDAGVTDDVVSSERCTCDNEGGSSAKHGEAMVGMLQAKSRTVIILAILAVVVAVVLIVWAFLVVNAGKTESAYPAEPEAIAAKQLIKTETDH